jgi:chromosome segregation ATPase
MVGSNPMEEEIQQYFADQTKKLDEQLKKVVEHMARRTDEEFAELKIAMEALQQRYQNDTDLLLNSLRKETDLGIQTSQKHIHGLKQDINALRDAIAKIYDYLSQLNEYLAANMAKKIDLELVKTEIEELKQISKGQAVDIKALRADVNSLKADVSGLKADVRELKQDMLEVKDNLRQILLILKKG